MAQKPSSRLRTAFDKLLQESHSYIQRFVQSADQLSNITECCGDLLQHGCTVFEFSINFFRSGVGIQNRLRALIKLSREQIHQMLPKPLAMGQKL